MLFASEWLARYVDLPEDPRETARRLTAAGLAVEQVEEVEGGGVVFDIEVTTNRPDCMNHFGVARELSVLLDRPLRAPSFDVEEDEERTDSVAKVIVHDPAGCPRYAARAVMGVKIGPSPEWMRKLLEAIGSRSINNVVDVTNFLLWEWGQPLHAFDLDKLTDHTVVVRRAREGEKLRTLDGVERTLDPSILAICDPAGVTALGGIMGGGESEVTDGTVNILIESAHFDRAIVRRGARRLGMHTDASHRFERGVDPTGCALAATRAAKLMAELAGGRVLSGAIDVVADEHLPRRRRGRISLSGLRGFAGAEIPASVAERALTGLGFEPRPAESGDGPAWEATIPSWRIFDFEPRPEPPHDLYPADLYEEVMRIHGFDRIAPTLPALPGSDGPRTPRQQVRDRAKDHLAACGFTEAIHFAFHDPEADAAYPSLRPEARPIRLANPLSERYAVLRRSLVPNLVETARFNQRRGASSVRLFEVATVFFDRPEGGLPDQPEMVGLVCGGRVGNPWEREVDLDFFDLKGVVESLADALAVRLDVRPAVLPGLLEGSTAELLRDGEVVGFLGRVAEEEGYPLYVSEIALDALLGGTVSLLVKVPSRYPGVDADFTLTHSLETPWAEIEAALRELRPEDLVSSSLKVRYRGPGVPEGAVNTTISFLYNARDRSLTQEEVNARQLALNQELERRFGFKG
ncbi:MAG TPA: phenylalanine--tRNA ligase subunit beta [Thermoanaerobaculia bacterium]|nr:phenylalanine--tRNA ligase subunit beta [Thermoanaerobaculia bacterium]